LEKTDANKVRTPSGGAQKAKKEKGEKKRIQAEPLKKARIPRKNEPN